MFGEDIVRKGLVLGLIDIGAVGALKIKPEVDFDPANKLVAGPFPFVEGCPKIEL